MRDYSLHNIGNYLQLLTTQTFHFVQANLEQYLLQSQGPLLLHYIVCSLLMLVCASNLTCRHVGNWFTLMPDLLDNWFISFHHASTGSGGLSFLQFCNLNSFRTKFILGFSIFMGLSIPQYFNEYTVINGYGPVHTGGRWVCTEYIKPRISYCWIM